MFRFLAYNNAIPIGISTVLLGGGVAFAASPEVANTVGQNIYSTETKVVSIDNSYLINKDLSTYTPEVTIKNVTEDADTYFIDFDFKTLDVQDSAWKDVLKSQVLKVSKAQLGEHVDLGVYATRQLKEVIDHEVALLKETQGIEKKNQSNKVIATVYGGLIGKLMTDKTEELPGYVPVVLPEVPAQMATETPSSGTPPAQEGSAATPAPKASGVLRVLGANPAEIPLKSGYADLGVIITNASLANFGVHTFVDDREMTDIQVDTSKPGTHTITYKLVDGTGVIAEATRTVNVFDPNPMPVVAPPVPATTTTTNASSTTP